MVLAEQIKEAASRRDTLEKCLDIERKRMDLQNEEEKTQEPDFWDDAARAQEQLRRVASIKSWITDYDTIRKEVEDLELMPDFLKEGVISEEEMDAHYAQTIAHIEALELRNMLRRDEDKMGAILDINAGAGGTEALDWASMLLRMYTRWGEAHGYKVKALDYQAGDEVGVKSCTLEFEGEYAYGYLKSENGVHRMVRLSPFNANNKRQTDLRVGVRVARCGRLDRGGRSTPRTSSGTRSARRAPAARTSTRSRRPCACAITARIPIRANRSSS